MRTFVEKRPRHVTIESMKRVAFLALTCACGPTPGDPGTITTTSNATTSTTTGTLDSTSTATPTTSGMSSATTTSEPASTTTTGSTSSATTSSTTTGESTADMTTDTTTGSITDEWLPCNEFMAPPDPPDGCVVPLDVEPGFPDWVEVFIDDMQISRTEDCASEDGWTYPDPMGPFDTIELCGAACEALHLAGEIEVHFFCVG